MNFLKNTRQYMEIDYMEELTRNNIQAEIERIDRDEIEPIQSNVDSIGGTRINEMLNRFLTYKTTLEDTLANDDMSVLVEYARNIFNNINWTSSDTNDLDNRIDAFRILVYIFNLLTSNKLNWNEIEHFQRNAEFIVNNISREGN